VRSRVAVAAVVVALAWLTQTAPAQAQQVFRVIVHPDNPSGPLSSDEISQIFLKTKSHWAHGAVAEPVDLSSSSSVREKFSEQVHGRPLAAVQSYWQKKIFSGSGVPPLEVESDAEVMAFIRQHPGGIGYVSAGAALTGVKPLVVRYAPERIKHVAPKYPPAAIRARAQGVVQLHIVINTAGDVADVSVIEGLPHGLTEEAIRAVRQWKYRPAMQDGQPVESSIDVSVQFQLS